MEKLFIAASLVGSLVYGITSCSKKEDGVNPTTQNSTSANRVVFESVEEYEQLFTDPNLTDSIASGIAARYGMVPSNARVGEDPEDTLYSEFLLNILNQDRIVQIQDWLIKVDKANEKVYVLETTYEEEYADLVNINLTNQHIMQFTTDDEVIHLLLEGYTGTPVYDNLRVSGLGICGSNAPFYYIKWYVDFNNQFSSSNASDFDFEGSRYINCYIKYDKEGINFALGYDVQTYEYTNGLSKRINVQYLGAGCDGFYRKKCASKSNFAYVSGSNNVDRVINYQHRGTRALDGYKLKCRPIVRFNNTTIEMYGREREIAAGNQ